MALYTRDIPGVGRHPRKRGKNGVLECILLSLSGFGEVAYHPSQGENICAAEFDVYAGTTGGHQHEIYRLAHRSIRSRWVITHSFASIFHKRATLYNERIGYDPSRFDPIVQKVRLNFFATPLDYPAGPAALDSTALDRDLARPQRTIPRRVSAKLREG